MRDELHTDIQKVLTSWCSLAVQLSDVFLWLWDNFSEGKKAYSSELLQHNTHFEKSSSLCMFCQMEGLLLRMTMALSDWLSIRAVLNCMLIILSARQCFCKQTTFQILAFVFHARKTKEEPVFNGRVTTGEV